MKSFRFNLIIFSTIFILFSSVFSSVFAQEPNQPVLQVLKPVKMAVTQPARDFPKISEKQIENWKDGIIPLRTPAEREKMNIKSGGFIQEYFGQTPSAGITQNWDGTGALGYAPPDPTGAVGPNHYVQMVNVRTQIWNKSGTSLAGPFDNINFWSGLGPPISETNDGDPIVLYDQLADRWLVSQFALPYYPNGPFYILIAISQTSDPTGSYNAYAWSFPDMPDYPKFGIWSDGYYMSANVFASGSGSYAGTYIAAFDRDAMLSGSGATMIMGQLTTSSWSLLPSDCDGVAPPAGAPNYFLSTYAPYNSGNSDLDIYEFHVDFDVPSNSTFTGPLLLSTPAFTMVNGIPQLGTGTLLDDLSDRPMQRLQYRNFGSHQSMVVCQTVDAGSGRAGVRWWELRKTSGNWGIYQEGTFAPSDGLFRWMGSIAMNQYGDIALGYSTSSSGMYPDIRYTGRLSGDPPGVMTIAEQIIHSGAGSQTSGLSRWGDYTHMSVDPVNDNTFWYTNQYQPTTGSFNWNTRIAAFDLGGGTQSQFLVWDGVLGGQDYSGSYINSFLTNLAYTVDYTSVFPSSLIGYEAVFLSFGNAGSGYTYFSSSMVAAVEEYLQAGGRVYLEGGDALEYDQYGTEPLHSLFGLGSGSDGGTNPIDGLAGQPNAITDPMLFTSSTQVGLSYIDMYTPSTGISAFNESGYGNVAVQSSGSYGQKTFCFSYALAYLDDGTFPSTKYELMSRIFDFLTSGTSPNIDVSPTSFTFDVTEGDTDADVLTINNLGELNLNWNLTEAGVIILKNGVEVPVSLSIRNSELPIVQGLFAEDIQNKVRKDLRNSNSAAILTDKSLNPGMPANPGPECSGGLIYDDGTVENGYGWNPVVTDGIMLSRFDPPSYPYNLAQVCINWTQVGGDANINYNIVVYDDDGAGGAPGTLLASIPVSANGVPYWPDFAFFDNNVTGQIPTVNSGSVYIGAQWDAIAEQYFYICSDESPTTLYHSGWAYNDVDGIWEPLHYWFPNYRAMFIRAEGNDAFPWITENPLSGNVPGFGNQLVDINIDATGLTAGTYDCNLVIINNDPANPQLAVPVTLNVTSANPPDINVIPTSLTFSIPEGGGTDTDVLNIANTAPGGSQSLNWSIIEQETVLKLDNGESIKINIQAGNTKRDWLDDFDINLWREKYKNVASLSEVSSDLVHSPNNTDSFGDILDSFTAPGTPSPIGVCYDPGLDAVWVTDESGVQIYLVSKTPPYTILQTLPIPSLTTMMQSNDVAVVGNTLYITDYNGDVSTHDDLILAVDKTTGVLLDYWELDGPGNPNPTDSIDMIIGLTVNGLGEFFASNNGDNIIRKIDLQPGGNWSTIATYTSPVGGPTACLDWAPMQNGFWVANIIGAPVFLTDPFFLPVNSFPAPGSLSSGITTLWDGNLWMCDFGTGLIYVIEGLPISDCPWLSEDPLIGTIPAGSSQNVDVTADAAGLTAGTYNCNILVNSNDPIDPQVVVPVTLNITPNNPPDINVLPPSLTFVVPEGGEDTDILTIENTAPSGYQNLDWSLFESPTIVLDNGKEIPVNLKMTNNTNKLVTTNKTKNLAKNINSPLSRKNSSNSVSQSKYSSHLDGTQHSMLPDPGLAAIRNMNNDLEIRENEFTSLLGGPAYGQNLTSSCANVGDWIRFPISTLIPTVLGNAPESLFGGDFDASGNLYAIDNVTRNTVLVDTSNGTSTVIGASGIAVSENPTGMAYDLTTGTMYGSSSDGATSFIYTVDLVSGVWTLVTPVTGIGPIIIDIAVHPATGQMYGHEMTNDEIVTIDKYTGSASTLIATGFPSNYAQGMNFDRKDGILYCYCYQGGGINNVLAVDVFTPAITNLGSLPCQELDVFAMPGGVDVPWISENPVNGTIPAGSSQNVDVTVNATGLTEGNYNCSLVITSNDPDENPVTVPVTLIVTNSPPPENFAIVTNFQDNNYHVIDIASNTITGPFLTGSLGSGGLLDPVITPDGQTALISDFSDQTVFFVDVSNPFAPSVLGSVNIGFYAEDICLTSDGAFAVVTDGGSSTSIGVIDVATRTLIQTLDISPRSAEAVAVGPDGTVLVADYLNSQIHVFVMNPTTGLLTDPATAIAVEIGPLNISISPDGQTAISANINSTSINTFQISAPGSVTLSGSIPNMLNVQSIAFDPSGARAFAVETGTSPDELAVLNVISPGNVTDSGTRIGLISDEIAGVGLYGVDVVDVSMDANWAYVGNPSSSTPQTDVAVVDLNTYTLAGNLTAGNYPTGITIGGAAGPVTDFTANFLVIDNCANSQNLIFGTAPDATDCYDAAYDCYGPPPPPAGAFGGWFEACSEVLFCDFKETNTNGVRIWDIYYQSATGCNPVSFNWNPTELPPEGNFHLIDPFTGELVNVNMRTTNSYTDVVGLGHLQILYNYEVAVDYSMAEGWNMISLPLEVPDPNYLTLFPNALPGTLFGFNGSYYSTETIGTCTGYWLRFPAAEVVTVEGIEITGCTIDLIAGWNLIGGPNCSVPAGNISDPGGVIIPGTLFGFNGSYYSATSVDASEGYWVRASGPGTISINCTSGLAKGNKYVTIPNEYINEFTSVEISDANNYKQTLYFNGKLDKEISIESFSLPPAAPEGSFDVRLAGGYWLSESDEISIILQASKYPVSITLSNLIPEKGYGYVLKEMINGKEINKQVVSEDAEILISNNKVTSLVLTKEKTIPTSFDLSQNYPNPFNPSTVIEYALPESRNVELSIYNALGEKVATLVSELQDAGYYSVTWNGTNNYGSKVGSGMYIYAIQAGNYRSVKKMMLVK